MLSVFKNTIVEKYFTAYESLSLGAKVSGGG
jgi:hypothetical protein